MQTLFGKVDKSAGFNEFWKMFPRDPMRSQRKAGRSKCLAMWRKKELYNEFELVMAALREDLHDIDKGKYQFAVNSSDQLHFFPGVQPWLNQDKWDRDVVTAPEPETPKAPPEPVEPAQMPMTAQEKASRLLEFRRMAGQTNNPRLAGGV